MTRTPDEIERGLTIPADIANPALEYVATQDAERGDWANPRDARQPDAPWPDADNPMLRLLLHKAQASIEAGMDIEMATLQLAVHAWFEGGVENYDRGQHDARRLRVVE